MHYSISMATMNQKCSNTLITTSLLLKLANYTMHEGETYFSVSMRAMTLDTFLYNYFFTVQTQYIHK